MAHPKIPALASILCIVLAFQGCASLKWEPDRVVSYTVREGDTITAIAQRFNAMNYEILQLNEIRDPQRLERGTVLQIPLRDGARVPQTGKLPRQPVSFQQVRLGGAQQQVGKLTWPLPGGRLRSPFGYRGSRFHEGLDIGAPEGAPIYAAHDGQVMYSNNGLSGYGNMVAIKGAGILSVYGHNSTNLVSPGEQVRRGEKIAEVGQTGRAQGPHLHFETRVPTGDKRWAAVDPLLFFP